MVFLFHSRQTSEVRSSGHADDLDVSQQLTDDSLAAFVPAGRLLQEEEEDVSQQLHSLPDIFICH